MKRFRITRSATLLQCIDVEAQTEDLAIDLSFDRDDWKTCKVYDTGYYDVEELN